MKVLYLSDVDGTLTRSSSDTSTKTREIFDELLKKNINFTVSTGRSLGGAVMIKEQLGLDLPVISFNGALVYDTEKNKPLSVIAIPENSLNLLFDKFEEVGLPYRFCLFNHKLNQVQSYRQSPIDFPISSLINKDTGLPYEDVIVKKDIRRHYKEGDVLYVGYSGEKDTLINFSKYIDNIDNISYCIHSDPYIDGYWYMDIYSDKAGKNCGAQFLKKYLKADELVAFGDNFNDICMLTNADRSYAVANANDEIKKIATGVLEDDTADCIANFIYQDAKEKHLI